MRSIGLALSLSLSALIAPLGATASDWAAERAAAGATLLANGPALASQLSAICDRAHGKYPQSCEASGVRCGGGASAVVPTWGAEMGPDIEVICRGLLLAIPLLLQDAQQIPVAQ